MSAVLEWLQGALVAIGIVSAPAATTFYGYVEGDYVYLSPHAAGTVIEIAVSEGEGIEAGGLVFRLDDGREKAALAAARARLAEARATLRDRETGGRPEEITAAEAQLADAEASLQLARRTLIRSEDLAKRGVVTDAKLDADRAALESAEAEVRRLADQLALTRLPARKDQIDAAREAVDAAAAEVRRAETELADRTVRAPAAGLVDRVFLEFGEQAGAGTPVVSLLPPENLKVRFFVPEPERQALAQGDRVFVGCSSCGERVPAIVTRFSSQAEHTPPVIYSLEERSRLVFAVEARPEEPLRLNPGQPVDVHPEP